MFSPVRLSISLLASVLAIHAVANAKTSSVEDDQALLQKAKQIHRKIVTFDSHVDVPVDLDAAADGKSQFDLVKVERGHLNGAALAVFVQQAKRTPESYTKAHAEAEAKYQTIVNVAKRNPNQAALAYSPATCGVWPNKGNLRLLSAF